jgi:hypothetical protein
VKPLEGIKPHARERLHLGLACALLGAVLAQLVLAAKAAADHRIAEIDGRLELLRRHNELMRENNTMRDALDLAAEKAKPQSMTLVDDLRELDERLEDEGA